MEGLNLKQGIQGIQGSLLTVSGNWKIFHIIEKIEGKIHIKEVMLLLCQEMLEEDFFLFSWERLGERLQKTIASSKTAPEVLDLKYRSKFKHSFANRGYLDCAILKPLHGFQEKRAHKAGDMQFFFKMFKMIFSRFSKYLKAT